MNKKPIKLNLSLLPILILIIGLVAVYFVFFKDKNIFEIKKQPEVRRLNGFPTEVYPQKELDKKRVVIRNEQELANFFNEIDDSGALILREKIDFNKEFLIGASSSTYNETGHSLIIKKLYEDKTKNKLIVSVKETEPGKTCVIELKKNAIVELVAISKTDMSITFERLKETKECN